MFITLDTFLKNHQNKKVETKLDAWLMFLGTDDPNRIMKLIEVFPEFVPLYQDIYMLCRNTEKVMGMFSEELRILDQNTVRYMMDEMQDTINEQADTINEQAGTINEQADTINEQADTINEQADTINEQADTISTQAKQLKEKELLEQRMKLLIKKLAEQNRVDDLMKYASDESYRDQLFVEFGI